MKAFIDKIRHDEYYDVITLSNRPSIGVFGFEDLFNNYLTYGQFEIEKTHQFVEGEYVAISLQDGNISAIENLNKIWKTDKLSITTRLKKLTKSQSDLKTICHVLVSTIVGILIFMTTVMLFSITNKTQNLLLLFCWLFFCVSFSIVYGYYRGRSIKFCQNTLVI